MDLFFQSGRNEGFPSHYGDQHNPAHTDVLTSGLILSFVILVFSFVVILPAYRSKKRYLTLSAIGGLSLFIGGIILVCNFGSSWEVGYMSVKSPYKPGSAAEVKGEIGLYVSLRGINITLKGDLEAGEGEIIHETIDYNEKFSWEWAQGRFGFGPYAGRIARDFRAAVIRGVPIPILQISEYFTFDGEGIRFGRHYRQAGYYAHFFLWTAFVMWVLSNILFFMSVLHGAICLGLAGILQLISVLIWTFNRNVNELHIPFEPSEGGDPEVLLSTSYGVDYYLVLVNGIICILIGIGIVVANFIIPEELCKIFGIDPLTLYQEEYQTQEEAERERNPNSVRPGTNVIELAPMSWRRTNTNAFEIRQKEEPVILRRRRRTRSDFKSIIESYRGRSRFEHERPTVSTA
jgi:hypothetical protein